MTLQYHQVPKFQVLNMQERKMGLTSGCNHSDVTRMYDNSQISNGAPFPWLSGVRVGRICTLVLTPKMAGLKVWTGDNNVSLDHVQDKPARHTITQT